MKIIDRYIIKSILKTAFAAIMIFALLLAAVELFMKMDQIMRGDIPIMSLLHYLSLSIPEYLMMVTSLSLLFATTYFLSSLSANNERIALLNAGLSPWRLREPVIVLAIILTLLGMCYQELLLNKVTTDKNRLELELFGLSSTQDMRNIVLKSENGYLIYTKAFSESREEIYSPVLVRYDGDRLVLRLEAESAKYSDGKWSFKNAKLYMLTDDDFSSRLESAWIESDFDMPIHLFRSQNLNIETMEGRDARDYLKRLYIADRTEWQAKATDYYRSAFQPLAIFTLMLISVLMNYSFKKNVLLFSIIESLSIAVVYYVADMVFSIAGHQGAIAPYLTVVLPILVTAALSFVISLTSRLV